MKNSIILCLLLFLVSCQETDSPQIISDFPGGNIKVVKLGTDTIWLEPDLSETKGDWFYWYFKVNNMAGRTLTFQFTKENQFTRFGPSVSINDNTQWNWLGEDRVTDNAFTYTFAPRDSAAYFCTAIPYTQSQWEGFLDTLETKHLLDREILATSREGREIECYRIGRYPEPRHRVLLTARHHACEMMASYVLEGIVASVLNDPELEYLRQNVEFMIVPFMDIDGVENGEQGKNRIPRDHNRDYEGTSLYPSTNAMRERVPEWAEEKLLIALDLHCPWIRGEYNEWIYLVGDANAVMAEEQKLFSEILEETNRGELGFRKSDFLPFGSAWNTGSNNKLGKTFAQWAGSMDHIKLASTIEFPYGSVLGTPVSVENAREFGRSIAFAILEYLQYTVE